jgi:CheY-like chemotaxis protein
MTAKVLVVEDEPLLRMLAIDIVEDAGFETLDAGNADDAIVLLETLDDIRILLTDIDMPGSMDGLKLAAAVRDRWPPIEIIIVSGMRKPSLDEMPRGSAFFQKPFNSTAMTDQLRRMAS